MRILHTGDWHLNHTLGAGTLRMDRSDDILRNVRRIAEYLKDYDAEVLVIAGDLFCDRATREDISRSVAALKDIFEPFLKGGGSIVAISGNHDSEIIFDTLRNAIGLAPGIAPRDGVEPGGRWHLAREPRIIRLMDRAGNVIPFVCQPWPGEKWLRGLPFEQSGAQNTTIQQRLKQYWESRIYPALTAAKDGPAVLVSHITVRGVTTRTGFKLTEEQDLIFEPGDVPTQFAYGAFGHIHKAEEVLPNTPWMRYSGSIERLDGGERDDDKSIALIEVGRTGRVGETTLLPLESAPFAFVTLEAAKDNALSVIERLEREWETHPDRDRVLVNVNGTYLPGRDNAYQIRRRLAALFPRLYAVDLRPVPVEAGGAVIDDGPPLDIRDVAKTAADYIADALKNDPRRGPILALFQSLLRPAFAPPSPGEGDKDVPADEPTPKVPLPEDSSAPMDEDVEEEEK